jgi:hypothetical protein
MTIYHKEYATGKWFDLTLLEQMGNIGSEVYRTFKWFRQKDDRFQNAFERALELFDFTLDDTRWKGRRKEIARSRELFCSLMTEPEKYENINDELDAMDKYFFYFALKARENK